jgi:hypothetical protein
MRRRTFRFSYASEADLWLSWAVNEELESIDECGDQVTPDPQEERHIKEFILSGQPDCFDDDDDETNDAEAQSGPSEVKSVRQSRLSKYRQSIQAAPPPPVWRQVTVTIGAFCALFASFGWRSGKRTKYLLAVVNFDRNTLRVSWCFLCSN